MKYNHIKTRLDEQISGFVDINHYSWLLRKGIIEFPEYIGSCNSFRIIHNMPYESIGIHINKKGHIVKNEA
jgi:hypothetical protein